MESRLVYNIYQKDKHTRCSNINFESEEAAWNYLSYINRLKKILTDRKSDDNYKERYYIKEAVVEVEDKEGKEEKKKVRKVKFKEKKPDSLTNSNPIEKETVTSSDGEWQLMTSAGLCYLFAKRSKN